jgi:hypothetical protein
MFKKNFNLISDEVPQRLNFTATKGKSGARRNGIGNGFDFGSESDVSGVTSYQ